MIRQLKNVFAALVVVLALAACASGAKAGGMDVQPVNANCPLMSDHAVDPEVTVDFNGHAVGFCCSKCVGKWEEWSDDKKAAFVENSLAAMK